MELPCKYALFSVVLLYLVHFLYFQTQYISHADFCNELFCVDSKTGTKGNLANKEENPTRTRQLCTMWVPIAN